MHSTASALDRCQGYRIYNLGESKTIKLAELIAMIEDACGVKAQIERLGDQPGDVPITYADISRACEELDYAPSVAVDEGLRRFMDWYRNETASKENPS